MNIIPIPLLPSKTFVLYILFFPVFFSRCDGLVYNLSFLHICWDFVSGSWRTEFSGRTAHSSLVINLNLFKIETWFLKNREVGFLYNFSFSNLKLFNNTLFESENERQKIEPVPIPLPRASRNFPDVKTRNEFFFHNWTSEIIPFIRFGMQMDGT